MRSNRRLKIGVALLATVSLLAAGACQTNDDGGGGDSQAASIGGPPGSSRFDSAAGDLTNDSSSNSAVAPIPGRWITDANILSLIRSMSASQTAAANVELQGWHSDSVRAFAASVARGQAALRQSVDSLAATVRITPAAPALAQPIAAKMQAQIDSLIAAGGAARDRAFLAQQVQGEGLMASYVRQLSAVAERPELQAFLASAAASVAPHVDRARALQTAFITADSVAAAAADSAAERTARRRR